MVKTKKYKVTIEMFDRKALDYLLSLTVALEEMPETKGKQCLEELKDLFLTSLLEQVPPGRTDVITQKFKRKK